MTLKDKIIHAAYDLFASKGFVKTTISDIIKAAGTSKGGFYHHFDSKEQIVDTIMALYVEDITTYFDHLYLEHTTNYMAIFTGVFDAINAYKRDQFTRWPQLMNMLSFPGNDMIIARMALNFEQATVAFYTRLIEKGNGLAWQVKTPAHVAGLWARELMRIYTQVTATLYSWSPTNLKDLEDLIDFNESLAASLLGVDQVVIKDAVLRYTHDAHQAMVDQNLLS